MTEEQASEFYKRSNVNSDSFRIVALKFSNSTSAHGVAHLMSTSGKQRVFWVLIIAIAAVYMTHELYALLDVYFSYQKTEYRESRKEMPPFPAVTFCNNRGIPPQRAEYVEELIGNISLKYGNQRRYYSHLFSTIGQKKALEVGYQLNEMLIYCQIYTRLCSFDSFTLFQTGNNFNCFTFSYKNGTKDKNIFHIGPKKGLSLVLFSSGDTVLKHRKYNFDIGSGIGVAIHQRDVIPVIEGNGIDISPGKMGKIYIKWKK